MDPTGGSYQSDRLSQYIIYSKADLITLEVE
jgi:hypothetical protein